MIVRVIFARTVVCVCTAEIVHFAGRVAQLSVSLWLLLCFLSAFFLFGKLCLGQISDIGLIITKMWQLASLA